LKISRYFSDLGRSYADEIDDLLTDSDGKAVLQQRLDVKRKEIGAILPMIDFSPEMVAVVFFDAFAFVSATALYAVAHSAPGERGFPTWAELSANVRVAPWAVPLVATTLKADGGDAFLVTTATLEFLRGHGQVGTAVLPEDDSDAAEHDEPDDDAQDLAEAGADWLAEQGFETTGH
jgi:hypothetical protein